MKIYHLQWFRWPDKCLSWLILLFFNPLPHNTTFWRAKDMKLWKTLWEKEKLLVTRNFSFFSQCFLSYMVLIFHFKCTLKWCLHFVSIWATLNFCCLVMVTVYYQHYDIVAAYAFMEFLWRLLHILFFSSHWLLSHITIVITMDSSEREKPSEENQWLARILCGVLV